jgi:hypothetical protein
MGSARSRRRSGDLSERDVDLGEVEILEVLERTERGAA